MRRFAVSVFPIFKKSFLHYLRSFSRRRPPCRLLDIGGAPRAHLSDTLVTKTHVVDIDLLEDTFGRQVEQTFYVVANRAEKDIAIDERYCGYSNVFCVDYDDFAYSPDSSSSEEIMVVVNRIKTGILDKFALPDGILMDTQRALDRVKRMEQATETMASKTCECRPFFCLSFMQTFFSIYFFSMRACRKLC